MRHEFTDKPRAGLNFGPGLCTERISEGTGYCAAHRNDDVHFPIVKPMEAKAEPLSQRGLLRALFMANELSGGANTDSEYVRGQAELICDLFGIPMDDSYLIIDLITKDRV